MFRADAEARKVIEAALDEPPVEGGIVAPRMLTRVLTQIRERLSTKEKLTVDEAELWNRARGRSAICASVDDRISRRARLMSACAILVTLESNDELNRPVTLKWLAAMPAPSIERTASGELRTPASAARVER
jgi:hypothetical protein